MAVFREKFEKCTPFVKAAIGALNQLCWIDADQDQ